MPVLAQTLTASPIDQTTPSAALDLVSNAVQRVNQQDR